MGNTRLKKQTLIKLVDYYEELYDLIDLMINEINGTSINDIVEVLKNVPQKVYEIKYNLLSKYEDTYYEQLNLL